jgi:hypothetical protein
VKNAQATLAATVQEILEVASDLSEKFELLILDDGSSDATSEIAMELTHNYPQVRALCQVRSIGRQEAIRSGLKQSRGDVVLLHEEKGGTSLEEIASLWRSTAPRGRFYLPPQSGHKTGAAGPSKTKKSSSRRGFRMLDRRSVDQPIPSSHPLMPNYLARLKEFAFSE